MVLIPQEVIRKKRDGEALGANELQAFVKGIADNSVSEAQVGAFAMAVFMNGMDATEQAIFTNAMRDSGRVMDWSGADLPGPIVDKHSTGGVGDKVSLPLAAIIAACGGYVPMISGRGLGHSGGTLDKLEAIPGYDASPSPARFTEIVCEAGCSIIGQTDDLAPADRRLYGVRDATGTVESIPLITASILSKKLAAGLDALIMDVKFGNGAFMETQDRARELAENIARVAGKAGTPTRALLTDMNQVLGRTAGNAVETLESVQMLRGDPADARLVECTLALAAEMLVIAGLEDARAAARSRAQAALSSGAAAERFAKMVAAQGGPVDFMEQPGAYLAAAPVQMPVYADTTGFVQAVDTRAIGMTVVTLGGGRTRADQDVDHRVGLTDIAGIGEEVRPNQPLALVHSANGDDAEAAATAVRRAFAVGEEPTTPGPIVSEFIG